MGFLSTDLSVFSILFFPKGDLLYICGKTLSATVENKKDLEQSQQELRFQAYHDDITLLPNEHFY